MPTLNHLVRSAILTGYLELADHFGLDGRVMMRKAGLPKRCLDDRETLISMASVRQLLESSAEAVRIEDFGLRLASKRHLSNLGPISLVLREQSTGLQALETLYRHLKLLNDALLMRIEHVGDSIIIREDLLLDRPTTARQTIELTVGVMCQIMRDLLGDHWYPRRASFSHRPPLDQKFHRELFGRHIEFNGEFNGIVCAANDLDRQLPRTDPHMARYAREFLDKALNRSPRANAETVRHLISLLLPGGRCTVDQVAQQLGVTRRTIHRYLQVENETFSTVLCAVRRQYAVRQLRDSDRAVAEVADLLGFSEASTFARWFRREFGTTSSDWRRAALQAQIRDSP